MDLAEMSRGLTRDHQLRGTRWMERGVRPGPKPEIGNPHRLEDVLDAALEIVVVGRVAAAGPALRLPGPGQHQPQAARLVHRPGQLARGMARVRLSQVDAAKLVQLHVAHAASEIVSDVAEQAGEERG